MIKLSRSAVEAQLQLLPVLIDAGTGQGWLEMRASNGTVLAKLFFSRPSADEPANGEIAFRPIESALATASGRAETAHAKDGDGRDVFEADIGTMDSSATIKMSEVNFIAGAPVRLKSFTLTTGN